MNLERLRNKRGGIAFGVLLWMLGVPLPVILLISMMRSC
jgi:hypothetical protein